MRSSKFVLENHIEFPQSFAKLCMDFHTLALQSLGKNKANRHRKCYKCHKRGHLANQCTEACTNCGIVHAKYLPCLYRVSCEIKNIREQLTNSFYQNCRKIDHYLLKDEEQHKEHFLSSSICHAENMVIQSTTSNKYKISHKQIKNYPKAYAYYKELLPYVLKSNKMVDIYYKSFYLGAISVQDTDDLSLYCYVEKNIAKIARFCPMEYPEFQIENILQNDINLRFSDVDVFYRRDKNYIYVSEEKDTNQKSIFKINEGQHLSYNYTICYAPKTYSKIVDLYANAKLTGELFNLEKQVGDLEKKRSRAVEELQAIHLQIKQDVSKRNELKRKAIADYCNIKQDLKNKIQTTQTAIITKMKGKREGLKQDLDNKYNKIKSLNNKIHEKKQLKDKAEKQRQKAVKKMNAAYESKEKAFAANTIRKPKIDKATDAAWKIDGLVHRIQQENLLHINPKYLASLKHDNPQAYENSRIDYYMKQYHVNDVERYPHIKSKVANFNQSKVSPAPEMSKSPAHEDIRFAKVENKPSKKGFFGKLSKLF